MTIEYTTRPENGRLRVQTVNEEESATVQSDRNMTDIRTILSRYAGAGVRLDLRQTDLTFKDVSEFDDYADMLRQLKDAEAAFMELPSKVREVFNGNVGEWLDAAHDKEKFEALRPELERIGAIDPVNPPAEGSSSSDPAPVATSPPPEGASESA